MYIWQFGFHNWVTYGRTWEEYEKFISVLSTVLDLSNERRLLVYVHNLAYEFQFIRKRFDWDNVFLLDDRKPAYALAGGIEYRCSLKLSSKSLANTATDLQKYKVEKLVGDLDYQLIRTSITPLTPKELGYCEHDIRVVLAYIQEKIEQDGDITKIPLTNTGYVRNYCRKKCFSRFKKYRGIMSDLTLEAAEYSQLKRAFQGGFTHARAKMSGKKLHKVGSFDFTSSYPTVMVAEKFPMSKSKIVDHIASDEELRYYLEQYCCLFDLTLYNVIPKVDYDHPLSASKTRHADGIVTDNGRVVSAVQLTTTVTEQDFWVYTQFYAWERMEIGNFRIYEKGYLPKEFVVSILDLYKKKTQLKGVDGEEINYMISKNMLNSAYGMSVTDIVRDILEYTDMDEFSSTKPDVEEAINTYNNGIKRFLFYPWGVWVTAYARANLFSGILAVGDDYIYSDTDSIKILHPEKHMDYIERYNTQITAKLARAAQFHKLSMDDFAPKNKKGEAKPMGVWDYEGVYDTFKTIGAKRYMTLKDGKFSLTVAGLNKASAMEYIKKKWKDPFDALKDGLVIPEDYSGRLTSTYIDEERAGVVVDYTGQSGWFSELSSIHMEPSQYELTLSDEYKAFLDYINGIKEDSW